MAFIELVKAWSRGLKSEALTVWYISKHPKAPLHTRALAFGLVAYAFSPIDLIPDFIPVLGYLDDLIVLPIGILIMLRMTPQDVVSECRHAASAHMDANAGKPSSRVGAILIVIGWIIVAVLIAVLSRDLFDGR